MKEEPKLSLCGNIFFLVLVNSLFVTERLGFRCHFSIT